MQWYGIRPSVRPSVRLSRLFLILIGCAAHTQSDSPGGSMWHGQRTFQPEYKEDGHTCSTWHYNTNGKQSAWGGASVPSLPIPSPFTFINTHSCLYTLWCIPTRLRTSFFLSCWLQSLIPSPVDQCHIFINFTPNKVFLNTACTCIFIVGKTSNAITNAFYPYMVFETLEIHPLVFPNHLSLPWISCRICVISVIPVPLQTSALNWTALECTVKTQQRVKKALTVACKVKDRRSACCCLVIDTVNQTSQRHDMWPSCHTTAGSSATELSYYNTQHATNGLNPQLTYAAINTTPLHHHPTSSLPPHYITTTHYIFMVIFQLSLDSPDKLGFISSNCSAKTQGGKWLRILSAKHSSWHPKFR